MKWIRVPKDRFCIPQADVDFGPSVWTGRALQAESDDLKVVGLALLYPALERNVCVPGHHGYPRALDLIRVSANLGDASHPICSTRSRRSAANKSNSSAEAPLAVVGAAPRACCTG